MSTTPPPSPNAAEPTLGAVYELEAATYRSGELRVLSFEGYEEINGLFAVEITFWAKDVDELDLQTALLGRPASLGMHLAGGSARYLRGIVRALTVEGKHAAGHHAFRLSLVPRLWLLGKRVNSRNLPGSDGTADRRRRARGARRGPGLEPPRQVRQQAVLRAA